MADYAASVKAGTSTAKMNAFLANEQADREVIAIKRAYIDMTSDIVQAAMISELAYWSLPNSLTGETKLRVERNGTLWLARTRTEWSQALAVSESTIDRVVRELKANELIVTEKFKFGGKPVLHIALNWPIFIEMYLKIIERRRVRAMAAGRLEESVDSTSSKRQSGFRQNDEVEVVKMTKTYTETTTDNTKNKKRPQAPEVPTAASKSFSLDDKEISKNHDVAPRPATCRSVPPAADPQEQAVYDAIVDICKVDGAKANFTNARRLAKKFVEAGRTPEQVYEFRERYRNFWMGKDGLAPTLKSLAENFRRLMEVEQPNQNQPLRDFRETVIHNNSTVADKVDAASAEVMADFFASMKR